MRGSGSDVVLATARRPVVTAPKTIEWLTVELPQRPAHGSVRIRSRTSLISPGTELRLVRGEPMMAGVWEGYANLDCPTIPPFEPAYAVAPETLPTGPIFPAGLGYNTVGEIVAVGEDVSGLAPGDRVLCIARHQSVFDLPAWEAWAIPADVPDDEAVYAYIATLGVAALRRARYSVGETVGVVGLGLVGLCAALAADSCGARVVGFDVAPQRLAQARSVLGAASVVDAGDEELGQIVERFAHPHGIEVVLEAGAGPAALALSMRVACVGGRVAVIALHPEDLGPLLGGQFNARQTELLGSTNDPYCDDASGAPRFTVGRNARFVLSLIARRKLTFAGIAHRRVSLDRLAEGYTGLEDGTVRELVVLIDWD